MESVKGKLLEAFYSFGNSQKNFWARVSLCLYNKFAGFFSKAAVNFICIVLLSNNKNQSKMSFGLKRVWCGKKFQKKIESFENLFRKMKEVHIEIYNFIFTFNWPKKFISWTTRKTQMTVFSAGTKRSGDTHRGTSTTSNISF